MTDHPPYPSGLRLSGRRVLVVGGGHVAQRRVPGLLAAGAHVVVVSPEVTPAIEGQVLAGEVAWLERGFADAGPRRHLVRHRGDERPGRERAGRQGRRGLAHLLRPRRRRHDRDGLDARRRTLRRPDRGRARPPRAAAYGRRPRRDRDRSPRGDDRGQRTPPVGPRRHPRRRGTGRPRADLGRRPPGPDGGRRGGRRPAGTARAAGRPAGRPPSWSTWRSSRAGGRPARRRSTG